MQRDREIERYRYKERPQIAKWFSSERLSTTTEAEKRQK